MTTESCANFLSNVWYRLTNLYIGPASSLDVVNDNGIQSKVTLQMATTGNFSGQEWQIVGSPIPGFKLCTRFLGRRKVLDVTCHLGRALIPHLAPPVVGSFGQIWMILSWGDGTYRLSSKATGECLHLDTYSNTMEPFMGDGDYTGQHWRITKIQTITDPENAMETESCLHGSSPSPNFSSKTWYRLTNHYMGYACSLDVVNDNGIQSSGTLQMAATGNHTGQHWRIEGNGTVGFTLRTRFLGRRMVLGVQCQPARDPTPHLAPPAVGGCGHIWTISPWGDGSYRLSSKATGKSLHLDTYSNTKALFMGKGNALGQHWQIKEVEAITDLHCA